MKRLFFLIFLTNFSIALHAQIDSVEVFNRLDQVDLQFQEIRRKYEESQNELQVLSSRNNTIQMIINGLSDRSDKLSSQIDSLKNLLQDNRNVFRILNQKLTEQKEELSGLISATRGNSNAVNNLSQKLTEQNEELSGQISETRKNTNKSVSELGEELSKNTLYWIIAVLAVAMLSIIAFVFLRKKVTDNQSSINESLASTRKEIEQEAIRLDEKLVRVMDTQMKIIQEERKGQPKNQDGEHDHSLALKVADEIVRIEKNISRMDEGTKGLKQLSKAVERIRDNFASNGYEMVEMIGKPFDDGLKCTANFRPDDSLEPGQKIITRIIKPQVNFKGRMIQSAQIEVSQGE